MCGHPGAALCPLFQPAPARGALRGVEETRSRPITASKPWRSSRPKTHCWRWGTTYLSRVSWSDATATHYFLGRFGEAVAFLSAAGMQYGRCGALTQEVDQLMGSVKLRTDPLYRSSSFAFGSLLTCVASLAFGSFLPNGFMLNLPLRAASGPEPNQNGQHTFKFSIQMEFVAAQSFKPVGLQGLANNLLSNYWKVF